MEEKINQEFEDFQKSLEIHNMNLRPKVTFEPDTKLDDMIDELKKKEVVL